MTKRQIGNLMVKSVPQLNLREVYPAVSEEINLNTCGDVDCDNDGVAPDFSLPTFKGRNATQRKLLASIKLPALATGKGIYTLDGDDKASRVSQVFEYQGDPHAWDDGRNLICHHQKGNRTCEVSFNIFSNEHLLDEIDRLMTQNGLLEGPVCGCCGARYLDAPDEFIFNGTHGKLAPARRGKRPKPSGFRIIHKPCKGQPGARISVSLDHQAQKKKSDNGAPAQGVGQWRKYQRPPTPFVGPRYGQEMRCEPYLQSYFLFGKDPARV
ncbi:hypothetical protein [Octadecabacter antarcticus]|uniref:hypothetical protein n=1 Tax=Octadecabacter antarcticus TaxID=1217908 RepID=UPI001FE14812|nr:hypothetical protein [Octadecabacter antarcticus]